jgi:putative hydrolase of the HAD superfamily
VALRGVFFDLGDTLVDLGEGRGSYEQRLALRTGHVYDALLPFGLPLPDRVAFAGELSAFSEAAYHDALSRMEGIDVFAVMRCFFDSAGIAATGAAIEAAGAAYCRGGGLHPAGLRPGALETLDALQAQGFVLGAISNTIQPGRFMMESLASRGLAPYFRVAVFSSDAGVAKPHPAIFRMALDAAGLGPEESVYIGDRLAPDVGGAHAAGMKGVLVELDYRDEDHAQIVPDARIRELMELPSVLAGLYRAKDGA